MDYDCLIVGSGHGGVQAAISLRQHGFAGSIALVSDDRDLPYERPPLSKDYLSGAKPFERILIRPPEFWAARNIDLLLGHEVTGLEAIEKRIFCANGTAFGYGQLIWAAGGRPRKMTCPGHELRGIHSVRSRGDVDGIMEELASVQRVVVIGGGYIGLEAAAVLLSSARQSSSWRRWIGYLPAWQPSLSLVSTRRSIAIMASMSDWKPV